MPAERQQRAVVGREAARVVGWLAVAVEQHAVRHRLTPRQRLADLGFGRVVVLVIEAPNMLANLV